MTSYVHLPHLKLWNWFMKFLYLFSGAIYIVSKFKKRSLPLLCRSLLLEPQPQLDQQQGEQGPVRRKGLGPGRSGNVKSQRKISGGIKKRINPSTDQSVNGLIWQQINPSLDQSVNRSTCQQINPSTDQSVNGSICQWINLSTDQSVNGSIHQQFNPTTDQSINGSIRQ